MTTPPLKDLFDAEGLTDFLFHRSPAPQALVERDSGRILDANRALASWIGVAPAELTGAFFPGWLEIASSGRGSFAWRRETSLLSGTAVVAITDAQPTVALCVISPERTESTPDGSADDIQHRLRNGLAVIRSIFRRTAQNSESVESLTGHFLGRLDALARVQSNVALYDRYGVELDDLILNELAAHAALPGGRFAINGPAVRLRTKAAETLSLAIHEVATNSVKYGALGSSEGTVSIKWHFMTSLGTTSLLFTWIEQRVSPMPDPPLHQGFGYDLLMNSLKFELEASSQLLFNEDGIEMHIVIPVNDRLLHPPR